MVITTGRNKGHNIKYDAAERDNIVQELYDFLKENPTIRKISERTDKPLPPTKNTYHNIVNRNENAIDMEILDNPSLYQGIQKIYRQHGVEIPSQRTVDKGEVITVKKRIIKENLKLSLEGEK